MLLILSGRRRRTDADLPSGVARRRGFILGIAVTAVVLLAGRVLVEETPVADWLVQPLLVRDTSASADIIVVPGAGVIGECVPNHHAVRRVLHAVRAYRHGRGGSILFTGGTGPDSCPVSLAMARLAEEMGVPASSIHVERASRSTHENARLSTPVLRALGARRLLVVTDALHMKRAAGAFLHYGFDVERRSVPVYEGHPDNASMLAAATREGLAIGYYRFQGWLQAPQRRPDGIEMAQPDRVKLEYPLRNPTGPVVILGASYAASWPLASIAGRSVINKGVAGQQSFEMLQRFEQDVVRQAPRAVLLWGFINDVFRAPVHEVDGALARTRQSYQEMIRLARAHGIEPILATEVTVRPPASWTNTVASWVGWLRGKRAYQDQINDHVLATNRWLADLAAKEGLLLLDFQAVLAENGGRRRAEFTREDGSHITPRGYDVLSAYARPVIEKRLADRSGTH